LRPRWWLDALGRLARRAWPLLSCRWDSAGLLRYGRRQGWSESGGWDRCSGGRCRLHRPRYSCWRYGFCLTATLRDRDRIDVVDDHRVVNVLENNVVRRWRCHVDGRSHPYRNWRVNRNWQQEDPEGRRGRRQHHEVGWRRW